MFLEDQVQFALEIFSLEELLELGDVSEEEILLFLVKTGTLELPEVLVVRELENNNEYD